MSSYIDVVHPDRHAPYLDIPNDVVEYLHYLDFVKMRSPRTINAYYLDLRGFFRFMMAMQWSRVPQDTPLEEINLKDISTEDIKKITKRDIFSYLDYVRSTDANGGKARARKLSALKGFFSYLVTQVNKLQENPTEGISLGSPKKALPKYLTAEESIDLLKNIQSDFYERDFCMITLFLNCGMRLTELVTINMGDFKQDTIRITGKGNKERLVYLNNACLEALDHYKKARAALPNLPADERALFVSKRTGKRLTARRVEQIVARCLQSAGLSGRGFSPHGGNTDVSGRCGYVGAERNFGPRERFHHADLHPHQPGAPARRGESLSPCGSRLYRGKQTLTAGPRRGRLTASR